MRQQKNLSWIWIIPLLLLMSLLVMLRIDVDGFWYDEFYSVRNSGGAMFGPLSPLGIVQRVIETDPYQSLGYPLFLGAWGSLAGWTAFASRVSSWLVGLLTVAVCYRAGYIALSSRWGGILTALSISLSAFFIHFNHELRTFTFVTLFSAILIWAYWHILTTKQTPSIWAKIAFVLSATGLLYSHFYTALLLAGLALYHLIFAKKGVRWLQITGLAILVAVLFIPQIPGFLSGFILFEPENLGQTPMTAVEVIQTLLYYASNSLIIPVSILFIVGIIAAIRDKQATILRLIIGISLLTVAVVLVANEALEMLEPRRIRYIIFLLPLLSIWLAGGTLALVRWGSQQFNLNPSISRIVLISLSLIWLGNGILANTSDTFTDSLEAEPIPRFRSLVTAFQDNLGSNDVLAVYNGTARDAFYMQEILALSLHEINIPTFFTANLYIDATQASTQATLNSADRVWYGVNRNLPLNDIHTQFLDDLEQNYTLCAKYVDKPSIGLTLWVTNPVFCPQDNPRIQYGEQFTLMDTAIDQSDEQLTVYLSWQLDEYVPPETYSLSLALLDPETNVVIRQQDEGFPFARYVSYTATLNLADVPPGDYALHLVVYEWQTGTRLTGTTASGETGDFLPIGTLSIP